MPANPFANGIRLSPSGPFISYAQLGVNLTPFLPPGPPGPPGLDGTITRSWQCEPPGPNPAVALLADTPTVVESLIITCDATQLGRSYLVWGKVIVDPADAAADPEEQPTAVLANIAMRADALGTVGITQQSAQQAIKLAKVTHGEGDIFPWVADGCVFATVKPGVTGPAFVVGVNQIQLVATCIDVAGLCRAVGGAQLCVLEVSGDQAANMIQVPALLPPGT